MSFPVGIPTVLCLTLLKGIETTEEDQLNQLENLEAENAKIEALILAKIEEASKFHALVFSGPTQPNHK